MKANLNFFKLISYFKTLKTVKVMIKVVHDKIINLPQKILVRWMDVWKL